MSSLPPSSDPRLAAMAVEPLTVAEIERRLGDVLEPALSTRRSAAPLAASIAALERGDQDFILHWAEVISRTNAELAYRFATAAPQALARLDHVQAEEWVIGAMDTYDRDGLYLGIAVFRNFDEYSKVARASAGAVAFEEVAQVLRLFLCGLSGRHLRLDTAGHGYTDTEVIYLPARVAVLPTREENFLVYKAMTTLLWAESRYGTFDVDLDAASKSWPDPARALDVLNALETHRLDFRIERSLPGLARKMRNLHSGKMDPRCLSLASEAATIDDSLALLQQVYRDFKATHCAYETVLRPAQALATKRARIARQRDELRIALAQFAGQECLDDGLRAEAVRRFSVALSERATALHDGRFEVRLDGEPLALPEGVNRLMHSIVQDLGEIPDGYLVAAGNGSYGDPSPSKHCPVDVWKGDHHNEGAFFYNEWDFKRRHYRKNWCVLREIDVPPGNGEFIEATLHKYAAQVTQLRRTFELLRGDEKILRKQTDGHDVDLDAVVSAYGDMKAGMELTERLFSKRHKSDRDLAVMLMVDMSGSTKGWINDAEREALVMLCEALQVLGDRYAIYGFSGITRKRCEIFRVKRFDEPYDWIVKSRIAGIGPQDYTRMGAAIRHLTMVLDRIDTRTKLLISLSDGKPDDYNDNYRGEYGIEDTRQALLEAQRAGVKPFCVTIDRQARDYLPHMYGPVNWILIDDVSQLPLKVGHIYQRLTS